MVRIRGAQRLAKYRGHQRQFFNIHTTQVLLQHRHALAQQGGVEQL